MRVQKWTIIWMSFICLFSLLLSIFLDRTIQNNYWSGILVGIFSSGLVTLFLSVISYNNDRLKALEEFFIQAHKALNKFNSFAYHDDINKSIDIVIEIASYDYTYLDNAYGNIDFIFNNEKLHKYIFDEIYKPLTDMKKLFVEKAFHFKEYKGAISGNKKVMRIFLEEIDKKLIHRDFSEVYGKDVTKIEYSYNKFYRSINNELNSRYYKIMYGKKIYLQEEK